MKTRLLIVDDEQNVLNGLKRSLHEFRNVWEMEFVDCGSDALDKMRQSPFDIVVSDMKMPGMNGAELMKVIQSEWPDSIRIILSGYSDQELILENLGTSHRILSKPCKPEGFAATIESVTSLMRSGKQKKLLHLISKVDKLPVLPDLYIKIQELLKDPESSLEDISGVLRRDIGMVGNVLKLVNSAYFSLPHEISDIEEAISFLGIGTIKSLVLGCGAIKSYSDTFTPEISADFLWHHSLSVAEITEKFLRMESGRKQGMDGAFLAGMMHDIGKLILYVNFPAEYRDVLQLSRSSGESLSDLEDKQFEVNHAEVGGYLLGMWSLNPAIVEAVTQHHSPGSLVLGSNNLALMVHVADAISNANGRDNPWGGCKTVDTGLLSDKEIHKQIQKWQQAIE